ncbi:GFA family protein [Pseudomonas sp. COR58]|uniref:GFA family protein n=1 Tax=Pseudomonas ekonensis TaxID=2842353 RepID=A0ABS6PC28_9PSED|nr:GFA family protein [Pseudomonas ekonensis]MBV4458024.1 GFA family protein [Pseudomonas ekonensis]
MTLAGGCRCGAVTYRSTTDLPLAVYACHCQHCQAWSGSSFALHALLPADAFTLEGPLTEYAYEDQGVRSRHHLCATCHTRIYNTTSAAPGLWVLRAGTLHERAALSPVAHIWIQHKQPWLNLPAGIPAWPESPTPEAFAAALSTAGQPASNP